MITFPSFRWVWVGLVVVGLLAEPGRAQEPPETLMGQPVEDFQERRQALWEELRESVSDDRPLVVVLRGFDTRDREDFEEGRFRQDNWFAYLTGVEIPGAFLILSPDGEGMKSVLYLPKGPLGSRFSGGIQPVPPPGADSEARFGVGEVARNDRVVVDLLSALVSGQKPEEEPLRPVLYTLNPRPRADDSSAGARFARLVREAAPGVEFRDLTEPLGELRKVKTEAELAILRRAIDVTGEAELAVMEAIEPGLFEYQLEGRIAFAFLNGGALRPGFASIVGSGPNAAIPHYFANTRQMESGDLVVVDIGAEIQNYTADITRTFPVSGTFSERQKALYQAVLDAQEEVEKAVKPGETRLSDLTGIASRSLRQSTLRARDQDGKEHTLDHFFIHGVSHYLGMDVHDVGSGREPLQPGEVFTIEPGLYIPAENVGIRIEDDYLVTETGVEKLSKRIPSDPEDVERIIAGGK
ncbi:MAG TPA: aminopeptidase P N-terminal domain-containing protein [Isosphaeraceae bacterium]|nr:aminopeptidase P N-terminal domain-containing protein [Isosphaeraceae bacterium]